MTKLIPKKFKLGGTEYTVQFVDNPLGVGNVAAISFPQCKVQIAKHYNDTIDCNDDYTEVSFFHELVHGILNAMGESEMNGDERFVEAFSNLLHQYLKTSEYE